VFGLALVNSKRCQVSVTVKVEEVAVEIFTSLIESFIVRLPEPSGLFNHIENVFEF